MSDFFTFTKTENVTFKVEDLAEEIYDFLGSVDDETKSDCEKALVYLNKQVYEKDTFYEHDPMSTPQGDYIWKFLDVVFTILKTDVFADVYKELRDADNVEWHKFLLNGVKMAFIRDLKDRIERIEHAGE